MLNMNQAPLSDDDDDDTTTTTLPHSDANGLANGGQITIKQVIRNIRKRKNGKPMPSTARRNLERRQRRRTQQSQSSSQQQQQQQSEQPEQPQSSQPPQQPQQPQQPQSPSQEEDQAAVVAPQLTLDENGNIVVDRASLVISAGSVTNAEAESGNVTTFENHEYTKHITSATYSKRKPSSKWLANETELFFQCLQKYGTDFLLMEREFPSRSRRQLKLKFKREERDNPQRIDRALHAPPSAQPEQQQSEQQQPEQQQPEQQQPEPQQPEQQLPEQQSAQQPATPGDTDAQEQQTHHEATSEVVTKVVGTADDDDDGDDQHHADAHLALPIGVVDSDDSWGDSDDAD